MTPPKTLVGSAVLGILLGACGGRSSEPTVPRGTTNDTPRREQMSCGNHEPGKCGAPSEQPLRITRTNTIDPGKGLELNLSFAAGARARARFKAAGPLAWNIHSHPAGGLVEHRKGSGREGEIAFEAAGAGVYSFMWTNEGTGAVTVEIDVEAQVGVSELEH